MELKHIFESVLREAQCLTLANNLFNLMVNNKDNLEDCEEIRNFFKDLYEDSIMEGSFFDGKIPNKNIITKPKKVINVEEKGEYFTSENGYSDDQLFRNIIHQLSNISKEDKYSAKQIKDANIGKTFGDITINESHLPEAVVRIIAKPYVTEFMNNAKSAGNFNNEITQTKRDNEKLMYKIQRDNEKQLDRQKSLFDALDR